MLGILKQAICTSNCEVQSVIIEKKENVTNVSLGFACGNVIYKINIVVLLCGGQSIPPWGFQEALSRDFSQASMIMSWFESVTLQTEGQ